MDINAYCLPFWSSAPPFREENGEGAGDICFEDSLQSYWREAPGFRFQARVTSGSLAFLCHQHIFYFAFWVFISTQHAEMELRGRLGAGSSESHVNQATSVSRIKDLLEISCAEAAQVSGPKQLSQAPTLLQLK